MSRLTDLLQRDIPHGDVVHLRRLMNLSDDFGMGGQDDLTHELRTAYWKWKLLHDRVSVGGLSEMDFKMIAYIAGLAEPIEGDEKSETVLDLYDAKELKIGDPVLFKFGRKEVAGYFQGITKDRRGVRVNAVDDAEIRTVAIADCIPDPDREPLDLTPASASRVDEQEAKPKNKGGRPRKHPLPETVGAASRSDIHAGQSHDDDI